MYSIIVINCYCGIKSHYEVMVLHFDTESADLKVISRQDQYNLTFSEPRKVRS